MKKILLSLSIVVSALASNAQVIVAGVSPQSIVANYAFTWADPAGGWGTPDFNIPGTFVEDTLQLSDDGSTGLNAQGNPVSASGCNALVPGSLAGKIAVVYRGDGTTNTNSGACEFGLKAFNAQNAGAVAVIVINRNPNEVIAMGAGADGANVTIPVVMISLADSALVNEMANGPVVVFMGNKTGLFANDISLLGRTTLAPKAAMVHSLLAQSGSEFNFDLGAKVFNPGNQNQTNVTLNATVTDPSGNVVYNNSVNNLAINSAFDSTEVAPGTLPNFSLSSYSSGEYTLVYSASIAGGTDEYLDDNSLTYKFSFNDSVYSYAKPSNGSINAANFYRPGTNNQTYSVCTVINDPNASRVAATGVYFSATKAANTDPLDGEEIALYLYEWEDAFTDLNDVNFPAGTAWTLTEVASGFYYYPSDLQNQIVYGAFTTPAVLEDNKRYLACAQTVNLELYLGYDNTDYTYNTDYYLQPMFPNESDGTYFAIGFGSDLPTALGVGLVDANDVSIAEVNTVDGVAYPNPATDNVTVSIEGEGVATLNVTDVTGKTVMTNSINLVGGKSDVNIAGLESGIYIFNVTLENGKTAQFNVVKK
jgi:hypothetical protein